MSYLVRDPEDRFARNEFQIQFTFEDGILFVRLMKLLVFVQNVMKIEYQEAADIK